ncbi:MAG TPA: hypothetical protein V6D20_11270 [Candidatus Obscuribacterales bacterium]
MAGNSLSLNMHYQAELDLLALFLETTPFEEDADASVYPWNPAAPESDAYFEHLEQDAIALGWSDELDQRAESLGQVMEQLWASTANPSMAETLQSRIHQALSVDVPQTIVDHIIQVAQRVAASGLALEEQLIQCVQDCLPTMANEDWQVLARPYAYAMRDSNSDSLEAALRTMRCAAWTELSGIEQARLSLAIARYSIAQMPRSESNPS